MAKEHTYSPLVSVLIMTYKSAETILETLEGVKAQTYPNIELIISDDCSPDNTKEICREWLEKNGSLFIRTKILLAPQNTGVSANVNRAFYASAGVYAVPTAGDDILLPECVQIGVDYMASHPDALVAFGRVSGFGRSQEEIEEYINRCFDYTFFDLSAEEQYHRLLFKGNCVPAAASMYNMSLVKKYKISNDERIPMIDDYPKWMSITKRGIQLRFIDAELVKYRLSENSISTTCTPSVRAKQSSALIFIYYQFGPRIKSFKSPIKKLGEIRKYIHAANTAWGGWFWKSVMVVDWCFAKTLNLFGAKLKV